MKFRFRSIKNLESLFNLILTKRNIFTFQTYVKSNLFICLLCLFNNATTLSASVPNIRCHHHHVVLVKAMSYSSLHISILLQSALHDSIVNCQVVCLAACYMQCMCQDMFMICSKWPSLHLA